MRPGPASVLSLVVVTALAGGVGVGVALTAPGTPASLAAGSPITEVPVTTRAFADERQLALQVSSGEARTLSTRAEGLVTATTCTDSGMLTSGTSSFAVDGAPLLNLHTTEPLWRTLAVGDRGSDVAALHGALRALGHDAPTGDRVTRGTLRALTEARAASDGSVPRSSVTEVDPARVVWLPDPAVTVSRCVAGAGAQVAVGDTLVELPVTVSRAVLVMPPADAAPGDRVLTVHGAVVPVDADGEVRDPEALAVLSASRSRPDTESTDVGADLVITVPWSLAEPLEVGVVPPGAVVGAGTAVTCVRDGADRAVPVAVVGSELGQTYVVPSAGSSLPASVRTAPSPGCGG